MAIFDEHYISIIKEVLKNGELQEDPNRDGVKRLNIPSTTIRHNKKDGFPALTVREVPIRNAWGELSMFLSGSTDIKDLWGRGVNFWDKDVATYHGLSLKDFKTLKEGYLKGLDILGNWSDMGKIYPYQYRRFSGEIDQIKTVFDTLKTNPLSSQMIVTAWNPKDLPESCLPPCHWGFQIIGIPLPNNKYGFEVHWMQRSTDLFLGTPTNIMYYFLLGMLLENYTGHEFLAVQGDLKNVHLYDNAIEGAKTLTEAESFPPPTVSLNCNHYDDMNGKQLTVHPYRTGKKIKVEMLNYNK